jgi:hypothetical protein
MPGCLELPQRPTCEPRNVTVSGMSGRSLTLALSILALAVPAIARAAPPSPEVVEAQRQEQLQTLLTDHYDARFIAGLRRVCVSGKNPADVEEDRGDGAYFTPDAADECAIVLLRTARDGQLPTLYREILTRLGGDAANAALWPKVIGATVLKDKTEVEIGNGKVTEVNQALAFDAGFAMAYQQGSAAHAAKADPAQLKVAAEDCLALKRTPHVCFSAGYLYGVKALQSPVAANP